MRPLHRSVTTRLLPIFHQSPSRRLLLLLRRYALPIGMHLITNEAGYLLGALLVFHGAGRIMEVGGKRSWNHLVIWTGMTCGVTTAWAILFRHILPWGYRDVSVAAKAYHPYQHYFQLYLACLVIFQCYYTVSSLVVDWFQFPSSPPARPISTRWPGVWWTFTHMVVVPIVVCGMVLDHALNLKPVAVSVFVSILLRYQLWLAKDSAINLLVAVSTDEDNPSEEDAMPATNTWSFLWFVLHLARVHSFVQLAQWWMDCMPLMGLQWAVVIPWSFAMPSSWTVPWFR